MGTYLEVDADDLNRFQNETERRLVHVLRLRGRRLEGRLASESGAHDGTLAIFAVIPEPDPKVWISEDRAEIASHEHGLRLEQWDAKTPKEHMEIAEDFLSEWLDSSDAV